MQQTPVSSSPLFRGAEAEPAEGLEPAMNTVNPTTAPGFSHRLSVTSLLHPGRAPSFPCDRSGEVHLIEREENMDDFFGVEDLLCQAYEDAVYAAVMPI